MPWCVADLCPERTVNNLAVGYPTLWLPEVLDADAWGWPYGVTAASTAPSGGNASSNPAGHFEARVSGSVLDRTLLGAP